jgi:hypothetical protein
METQEETNSGEWRKAVKRQGLGIAENLPFLPNQDKP